MPRPAPSALELLPCDRWPSPGAWWVEPWSEPESIDAREKYRAMSEALAQTPIEPARLRAIAVRWPGALREAQLTPPELYRARAGAIPEPGPKRGAVPLWSELHRLTADVARMRSRPHTPFLALDPGRRACWPREPIDWPAWVLGRFDARLAFAWLAALAGLTPTELDAALRR